MKPTKSLELLEAEARADEAVQHVQGLADAYVRFVDRDPAATPEETRNMVSNLLVHFARMWYSGRNLLNVAATELEAATDLEVVAGETWDF